MGSPAPEAVYLDEILYIPLTHDGGHISDPSTHWSQGGRVYRPWSNDLRRAS